MTFENKGRKVNVAFTGSRDVDDILVTPLIDEILDTLPSDTLIITGASTGIDFWVAYRAHLKRFIVHTVVPADRSRVHPLWRDVCDTYEELLPSPEPYRARNERMVALANRVIALPDYAEDHPLSKRSGTWMTIRIARRQQKIVEEDIHILRGEG